MRTCCCSLPYLDTDACTTCTNCVSDGRMFIPFDPAKHSFEIHDGRYIIILRDEP